MEMLIIKFLICLGWKTQFWNYNEIHFWSLLLGMVSLLLDYVYFRTSVQLYYLEMEKFVILDLLI